MSLQSWLEQRWYGGVTPGLPLRLLSRLFGWLVRRRRRAFLSRQRAIFRPAVPVLVVGNISVGGVGKTPLVIALCKALQQRGYRPGVVSRGYGRHSRGLQRIEACSDAQWVGDEPKLIFSATGCPVAVAERRAEAAQALQAEGRVDLLIADDGLQHYALDRDIEIAVIDGARGLGNGQLLPAGPLREPPQRLEECDFRVSNGHYAGKPEIRMDATIELRPRRLRALGPQARGGVSDQPLEWLQGREVHAVAGIGNPQRFFASLRSLGAQSIEHPLPDHHRFAAADLNWPDDKPVVMTEKDAVKCEHLLRREAFALETDLQLDDEMVERLVQLIETRKPRASV